MGAVAGLRVGGDCTQFSERPSTAPPVETNSTSNFSDSASEADMLDAVLNKHADRLMILMEQKMMSKSQSMIRTEGE